MGTADLAAAHVNGGNDDLFRSQLGHQQAHSSNVRHSVQGSHFVEVDLGHGNAMAVAFRFRNQLVHRQDVLFHPFR